jgi:hypothetical protein
MFSGVSEIEVKMAERAWEAAVLPLNYARLIYQYFTCGSRPVSPIKSGATLVARQRPSSP